MFWLYAILGALGLAEWLRRMVINKMIFMAWGYIVPSLETAIKKIEKYMVDDEKKWRRQRKPVAGWTSKF